MRVGAAQRGLVGCLLACACALALAAAPAGAITVSPRIIGGSTVPIEQHPWQVAIVSHGGAPLATQFCGGVVIDARHVVTAAHCLDVDPPDGVDPAASRDIVAGSADLLLPGASSQRVQLLSWETMPTYDDPIPGQDDVAVAELSAPLDFSTAQVQPAMLAASGERTAPGAPLTVSGWGVVSNASSVPSRDLRAVDILAVDDGTCDNVYFPDFEPDSMLCAIDVGKDSCNGDSGGPLTAPDDTLVGLVSSGPDPCADPGLAPGIYTELADPAVAAWMRSFGYSPPAVTTAPALDGSATAGQVLTCQPGKWSPGVPGEPARDYRFETTTGGTLRRWDPSPLYTVSAADVGQRIRCLERARDAGGAAQVASAASAAVVLPAPPPPPPVTQPTTNTTPSTTPATRTTDATAPRARFISIRCVRRRCTIRVFASDPGKGASGVRSVRVTVLPVRGRSRTLTARRIATGVYEIRTKRMPRGVAWVTLTASDAAGNKLPEPAIRRLRVR